MPFFLALCLSCPLFLHTFSRAVCCACAFARTSTHKNVYLSRPLTTELCLNLSMWGQFHGFISKMEKKEKITTIISCSEFCFFVFSSFHALHATVRMYKFTTKRANMIRSRTNRDELNAPIFIYNIVIFEWKCCREWYIYFARIRIKCASVRVDRCNVLEMHIFSSKKKRKKIATWIWNQERPTESDK